MALNPKFKGHRLAFQSEVSPYETGSADVLNTVELYLDYVCPYSAKLYKTLYSEVVPRIRADPSLSSKVQFVFRQQVQPWHPTSTHTHEAGLAVLRLAPAKFWDFSDALFKDQKAYFDANVVNEGRNDTYRRLAKLAKDSVGLDEEAVYALLVVPDKPDASGDLNLGNQVTTDFKLIVRAARLVGVHVSPTVIFNGIVNNDISSGWTADQWIDFLKKSAL